MSAPITKQQRAILTLLYEYRFLHRRHLQILLNHKSNARVALWLKDLREKGYIDWFYSRTNLVAKNTPAIYFLSRQGIKVLQKDSRYPLEALRSRAKDTERSLAFQERHLHIADACIALQHTDNVKYLLILPVSFAQAPHNSTFLTSLKPHLFFQKQDGPAISHFVLESFSSSLPLYQLRKRLRDYLRHLVLEWDDSYGAAPTALFICPTKYLHITIERYLKRILQDQYPEESPAVRLTTLDQLTHATILDAIWDPPIQARES